MKPRGLESLDKTKLDQWRSLHQQHEAHEMADRAYREILKRLDAIAAQAVGMLQGSSSRKGRPSVGIVLSKDKTPEGLEFAELARVFTEVMYQTNDPVQKRVNVVVTMGYGHDADQVMYDNNEGEEQLSTILGTDGTEWHSEWDDSRSESTIKILSSIEKLLREASEGNCDISKAETAIEEVIGALTEIEESMEYIAAAYEDGSLNPRPR